MTDRNKQDRSNHFATRSARTALGVLVMSLAAAGIVACSKSGESTTAGQKVDAAVATTEAKAEQAASAASKGLTEAKEAVKDAAQDVKQATQSAASTVGDKVGDAAITTAVNAELAKDSSLSALKIDVDTVSGRVKLTGTAPSATARDRASDLAKGVKGVSEVDNQLRVDAK